MPTPFMHLDFAERLRAHPQLDQGICCRLQQYWPAFYLGNIAADYQTICAIPRENTHFYPLPPTPGQQAHETMLAQYPILDDVARMPAAQAVFIAGYCFHLIEDLAWYWQVLEPFFFRSDNWPPDRRFRFVVHNTLLTYLDQQARRALPADAGLTLASAAPDHWLPFAEDQDLLRWRDLIGEQLEPGRNSETIAIYARRLGMSIAEFSDNLANVEWMNEQVFTKVPLPHVERILTDGIDQAAQFINSYLAPIALGSPPT